MAATEVSICSNASLLLGGNPINSLSEDTDRARLASNLFEPVRDYVLRRHPWNCAIRRVILSPDSLTATEEAQKFDWTFQFSLPDDYMRTLSVGLLGYEVEYAVESRKLMSNDDPCYLRYIWKNTNPATWDEMLVWGMTMSMKAVMAYPITQSTSLEQLVEAALKDVLKQARAVDGQDKTPETLGDSPLLSSRFGYNPSGNLWRGQ